MVRQLKVFNGDQNRKRTIRRQALSVNSQRPGRIGMEGSETDSQVLKSVRILNFSLLI